MDFERAGWQVGGVIEGLRLERVLGAGGMGQVFLGRSAEGAEFALKVLPAEVPAEMRERFCREGEAQARADQHPHVLRVRRAGVAHGRAYLVLDLASGGDLAERLEGGALSIDAVYELGEALTSALAYVHDQGVIHRDLKPSNVVYDAAGVPKLADFGLARLEGAQTITASQVTIGTPGFMAPEQADRTLGSIDERTDVYGLGALLFAAATGRAPFEGNTIQLVTAGLIQEAPRLRDLCPGSPPQLDAVLARCLRKEPERRFRSARELGEALRAARGGTYRAGGARASSAALALLVCALAVAGFVALAGWRTDPEPAPAVNVNARLEIAPAEAYSLTRRVEVRGVAREFPPGAKVQVGEGAAQQVAADGAFALSARLEPGANLLRVRLLDRDGLVLVEEPHAARFLVTPRWYQLLDPSRRPPLPLPDGLEFGEAAQEYLYREGSILVYVPPGEFVMGRPDDDVIGGTLEGDQLGARSLRVRLTRGYFIGKHELTWGQWTRYAREVGRPEHPRFLKCRPEANEVGSTLTHGIGEDFFASDRHPVHGVTWEEADAYGSHFGLRLPREAEWEFAAHGDQAGRYPWGDAAPSPALLNRHDPKDPWPYTAPVDACPEGASPFGCLNMAGNVAEFVADFYGPYPEGPLTDPRGPKEGKQRVWRGWDWSVDNAQAFYVYQRWAEFPRHRTPLLGLRVALSAQ